MEIDEPQKPGIPEITVGDDLSNLSIEELRSRIETLHEEIARHEAEIAGKQSSMSAAEGFFKS